MLVVGAGDRRCPVRERETEVARVGVVQKTSRQRPRDSDGKSMSFSKVGLLVFIATVVNYAAEMDRKSQNIEVVVAEAEKYLGLQGFTAEQLQGVLGSSGISSQTIGLEYDEVGLTRIIISHLQVQNPKFLQVNLPVQAPQRRKGRTVLFSEFHTNKYSETFQKLSFIDKTILNTQYLYSSL